MGGGGGGIEKKKKKVIYILSPHSIKSIEWSKSYRMTYDTVFRPHISFLFFFFCGELETLRGPETKDFYESNMLFIQQTFF